MKPIIEVRNLYKKYRIGVKQSYYSLRDSLAEMAKNPFFPFKRKKIDKDSLASDEFWALKNVSFKINPGEAVGVIGLNGAGKTTLLKLLCQITPPTRGEIIIRGKIASLLEVGTGFHPELTGRENIYLNGSILGMSQKEIKKRFDEIVNFAEIEKFLDTPVKRYSSGMYMRLAFSVAAHLEPDILLIDEVLSVGDVTFQKKCLGKMEDITGKGRTVLFVSHNMQIVLRYCQKAVLLDKGEMMKFGLIQEVVNDYLYYKQKVATFRKWTDLGRAPGDDIVRLTEVRLWENNHHAKETIDIRSMIRVDIEYRVLKKGVTLVPSIQLSNEQGIIVFSSNDTDNLWNWKSREEGRYVSSAFIPGNFLSEGSYLLRVVIASYKPPKKHLSEKDLMTFYVVDPGGIDTSRGNYIGRIDGVVRPFLKWITKKYQ
jgi:lipopolysaccharide transport system ATP-binding protein